MDDDIPGLEQRATRGEERGAAHVLGAARAHAERPSPHRSGAIGVGAIALALATIAGAVTLSRGDDATSIAAPDTTTTVPVDPVPVIAQSEASLVLFNSCANVLAELKADALDRVGPYGLPGRYGPFGFLSTQEQGAFISDRFSQSGGLKEIGSDDASETNNQEEGVDEPDLVETDGRRLFDVHGGVLRVVDAAHARVVATLPLGLVNVHGAVLVDDVLVVFANEPLSDYRAGETKVVLVDVAGAPVIGERMTVDGSIVDVRAVAGRVHLVTASVPTIAFTYPTGVDEGAEEAATEANRERIRSSSLADWLPSVTVTAPDGTVVRDHEQLTGCTSIRRPKAFAGFDQTSLVTLDLDDLSASDSTSVQAASLLVYGSADNLYTTTSVDDLEPDTPRAVDGSVNASPHTDIHRFSLDGTPSYAGSGRVAGYVRDQFGLSEHEGHLRAASTTRDGSTRSRVTVLRLAQGELVQTGVVDGLGVNEDIQGVRFVGDVGYVVTFRRTDPLHVIDLSDPATPRLAGVLHVPGYSAYLHPVGDGLLLGVGHDGTEDGRLTGAAVSLIDVHDPIAPVRADLEAFGPLTSPVTEPDHHAFLWWPTTATAYVPVGTLGIGGSVQVVRLAEGTLTRVGAVSPAGAPDPVDVVFDRVVIIGDRLLSVSRSGVQVSDLATLAPIAWVPFP